MEQPFAVKLFHFPGAIRSLPQAKYRAGQRNCALQNIAKNQLRDRSHQDLKTPRESVEIKYPTAGMMAEINGRSTFRTMRKREIKRYVARPMKIRRGRLVSHALSSSTFRLRSLISLMSCSNASSVIMLSLLYILSPAFGYENHRKPIAGLFAGTRISARTKFRQ